MLTIIAILIVYAACRIMESLVNKIYWEVRDEVARRRQEKREELQAAVAAQWELCRLEKEQAEDAFVGLGIGSHSDWSEDEPFETFGRVREYLQQYGYIPELDKVLERFEKNHPLWFASLVAEGLVDGAKNRKRYCPVCGADDCDIPF